MSKAEDRRIVTGPDIEEDDLDALLAQIIPESVHVEVSFGPPVGKELL